MLCRRILRANWWPRRPWCHNWWKSVPAKENVRIIIIYCRIQIQIRGIIRWSWWCNMGSRISVVAILDHPTTAWDARVAGSRSKATRSKRVKSITHFLRIFSQRWLLKFIWPMRSTRLSRMRIWGKSSPPLIHNTPTSSKCQERAQYGWVIQMKRNRKKD